MKQVEPVQSPADTNALNGARLTCEALVRALGGNLLAAYLHGSAVLGGYHPDRSDLDILALTDRAISDAELQAVVVALSGGVYPAKGLEMSLLTKEEAALPDPRAPRFQLHLTTGGPDGVIRVVDGRNREGDRDLILHFAVCRMGGMTLVGPPPEETLAPVPVRTVRLAMLDEIEWAATAPLEYLVLTSARSWLFAATGRIASKIEAGEWAAERYPEPTAIEAALTYQRGGEAAVDASAARDFARYAAGVLRGQLPEEWTSDESSSLHHHD